MPRVVLVADRTLSLAGLRSILDSDDDVTVAGEASDGERALELVKKLRPDVVVIDALAYRIDAVELVTNMTREFGVDIPPIMLLANVPEGRLLKVFPREVRALLFSQSSSDELVAAIQMVAAGYALMAPSQVSGIGLTHVLAPDSFHDDRLKELTGRELDVLELVACGLSNAEISNKLSVSQSTIKSHVRSTLAKLGLRNRVQLVITAYRLGLVGQRCARSGGGRDDLPAHWREAGTRRRPAPTQG